MHTTVTDRLEYDIDFGRGIMQACGLKLYTPEIRGINVAIGGWFNGTKFCKPLLYYFLQQKLMVGDIGPDTPGMGVISTYRTHSRIFQETLAKVEVFLKTTRYRGYIGTDCTVTNDGVFVNQWIISSNSIILEIHKDMPQTGIWEDFLKQLLLGQDEIVPIDTSKWNVSICLYTVPWPLILTQIYTGSDINLRVAQEKAYRKVHEVDLNDELYRTDIADEVLKNLPTLKSWGWIK